MSKDDSQGQTHYSPQAEFEGRLNLFIRDVTSKMKPMSKSEVRRRFWALVALRDIYT